MTTSESPVASSQWPRIIRSLGYKDFRLYWSGQAVSQVGTWMQVVAQSWVVYDLTDSPFMLGLVNFVALLPVLPVSLLSGVISDRFSKRNLMLVTETILLFQAMVMAVLVWMNLIQVWHVIILSLILGITAAMEQPARLAFVVEMVSDEDLSNAVALNSSAYNSGRIIGPALAGVLIASVGLATAFFVNSITYLIFVLALMAIRVAPRQKPSGKLMVIGSLRDGFQYIWDNKIVIGLLFIISIASFLTIPYIALMPVFAKDILQVGPDGLGFLLTAVGVGAILGAMLVAYLKSGNRGKWLLWANIIGPLFLFLFCISNSFNLSLLLVVFIGASNAMRLTLANSLTQLNTSEEYHGRVMSIFNLLFNGMSRVGALIIGGLAEIISVSWALGLSAGISAVIGLFILLYMHNIREVA